MKRTTADPIWEHAIATVRCVEGPLPDAAVRLRAADALRAGAGLRRLPVGPDDRPELRDPACRRLDAGRVPMTDAEAADMLGQLKAHFGEPVQPVSQYCAAIQTWFRQIELANREPGQQGASYHQLLRRIEIDIQKSNLLARLIYGGEQLRTTKCPEHKGHWAGVPQQYCAHGCQHTGWLSPEHPYRGVRVEAFGDVPALFVCQTCGGAESASVHASVSP